MYVGTVVVLCICLPKTAGVKTMETKCSLHSQKHFLL